MPNLDDKVYERLTRLSSEGDSLVNVDDYAGGLRKYHEAWGLLPEPKEDWEASTWLLAAIGDAHFFAKDFRTAVSALTNALRCPGGLGNPFIHLRLGESYFELGDMRRAGDELTRAYMGAGREIFKNEEPKYFQLLETVLQPPAGQSTL